MIVERYCSKKDCVFVASNQHLLLIPQNPVKKRKHVLYANRTIQQLYTDIKIYQKNHVDNNSQTLKKDVKVSVMTNCTRLQSEIISLCVVPVNVYHKSNPDLIIKTFALLDNGSQGSFVHNDIVHDLNLYGIETSVTI